MTRPSVLILGARSDIGLAIAHGYAAEGHPILLAARNADRLSAERDDIALRYGVEVSLHDLDALDLDSHQGFLDSLSELPQIAVSAIGYMGDQRHSEEDPSAAALVMRSNFEGPASLLAHLANRMEARGHGTLIGISSVAGDRGRATNYVYGAAKAGFTAFLSGLRNRLAKKGVHVLTVKPGFVNTRMTAGLDLPARLTAEPSQVAAAVIRAAASKRNILYVKPIWLLVMSIICAIPEAIFKRLKL